MAKEKRIFTKEEKQQVKLALKEAKAFEKNYTLGHLIIERDKEFESGVVGEATMNLTNECIRIANIYDNPIKPNYKKVYKYLYSAINSGCPDIETLERAKKLVKDNPKVLKNTKWFIDLCNNRIKEFSDPKLKEKMDKQRAKEMEYRNKLAEDIKGNKVSSNKTYEPPSILKVIKVNHNGDYAKHYSEAHHNLHLCPNCSAPGKNLKQESTTVDDQLSRDRACLADYRHTESVYCCKNCGFKYNFVEDITKSMGKKLDSRKEWTIEYYLNYKFKYTALTPVSEKVTKLLEEMSEEKQITNFSKASYENASSVINVKIID